jgi:MFS transporter, FSR family, fosmidomycin resistance protein
VPIALASSWRVALACAGTLVFAVLAVLWLNREPLALDVAAPPAHAKASAAPAEGTFDFLRIPAVWMCFGFFLLYAVALSVVQSFAPEAARQLHAVPLHLAAICLSTYMVCSAAGMVVGGFLASDPARCERIVAAGLATAAGIALTIGYATLPALAVPVLFGAMGLASGVSSPSRDMIVKQSTPPNATGRVYGVVYAGLDIGQALAPLLFGRLMDLHRHTTIWLGLALVQAALIATAFNVGRVRRTVAHPVQPA